MSIMDVRALLLTSLSSEVALKNCYRCRVGKKCYSICFTMEHRYLTVTSIKQIFTKSDLTKRVAKRIRHMRWSAGVRRKTVSVRTQTPGFFLMSHSKCCFETQTEDELSEEDVGTQTTEDLLPHREVGTQTIGVLLKRNFGINERRDLLCVVPIWNTFHKAVQTFNPEFCAVSTQTEKLELWSKADMQLQLQLALLVHNMHNKLLPCESCTDLKDESVKCDKLACIYEACENSQWCTYAPPATTAEMTKQITDFITRFLKGAGTIEFKQQQQQPQPQQQQLEPLPVGDHQITLKQFEDHINKQEEFNEKLVMRMRNEKYHILDVLKQISSMIAKQCSSTNKNSKLLEKVRDMIADIVIKDSVREMVRGCDEDQDNDINQMKYNFPSQQSSSSHSPIVIMPTPKKPNQITGHFNTSVNSKSCSDSSVIGFINPNPNKVGYGIYGAGASARAGARTCVGPGAGAGASAGASAGARAGAGTGAGASAVTGAGGGSVRISTGGGLGTRVGDGAVRVGDGTVRVGIGVGNNITVSDNTNIRQPLRYTLISSEIGKNNFERSYHTRCNYLKSLSNYDTESQSSTPKKYLQSTRIPKSEECSTSSY